MATPIIFKESVPDKSNNGDLLYQREQLIDETHSMSEGERIAWLHNGQATTDLKHYDTQGNIYVIGNKYFDKVHVWKNGVQYRSNIYSLFIALGQRQTSDTWIPAEWELV